MGFHGGIPGPTQWLLNEMTGSLSLYYDSITHRHRPTTVHYES